MAGHPKNLRRYKIRVEFELDEADVKELIDAAPKGVKKLTSAELDKLKEKGAVRASDFSDEGQNRPENGALLQPGIQTSGVKKGG